MVPVDNWYISVDLLDTELPLDDRLGLVDSRDLGALLGVSTS
jgi:hypothetical protein